MITASDVKELREKTGVGMMDCKKALAETNGNLEAAIDFLRTKGFAKAAKKASRIAAEGVILSTVNENKAILLEINCETDFVSKSDNFQNFAKSIGDFTLAEEIKSIEKLQAARTSEVTEATMKFGEKVDLRRLTTISTTGVLGVYNHSGRIGVVIDIEAKSNNIKIQELAKDIAMHVAATSPKFLSSDDIDQDFKNREADVYRAQLKEEGKPEKMIENIVKGKLGKLIKEVCLLNQPFVKNPDVNISQLISNLSSEINEAISIKSFHKLVLGEGIEKKEDNLKDEVAKMTSK